MILINKWFPFNILFGLNRSC